MGLDPFKNQVKEKLAASWQLPLLLFSFGLFGYAVWLFVDPKPGPTLDEQIAAAGQLIAQDRPDAAIERLNKITRDTKLTPAQRGTTHILLAWALDRGQQLARVDLDANHRQIIEQTSLALAAEKELTAEDYKRMGNSQEKLGHVEAALVSYRKAAGIDTKRALSMQRRIVEVLMGRGDLTTADEELLKFFQVEDLSDIERSWALSVRGQIAVEQQRFTEALQMFDDAAKLGVMGDPSHQGEIAYRRGYAAWKTGDLKEAERLLRLARDLMGIANPLDADAAMALGDLLMQQDNRIEEAAAFYNAVVISHPAAQFAPLARLRLGLARAMTGEDAFALEHFRLVTRLIESQRRFIALRAPAIDVLKVAARQFQNRGNIDAALEVMSYEQALDPAPPAGFFLRLGELLLARADQLEKQASDLPQGDRIQRQEQARDTRSKAGTAFVTYSQKLTLLDDEGYAGALWRGIDAFDRAGNTQAAIAALELFVVERPGDALAPKAMLRLGKTYQAAGMFEKSIEAFGRLQLLFPQSLEAIQSSVPLAQAYCNKGPQGLADAERVLMRVIDNNPQVTPDSNEFRHAIFELGRLYYRTGRFEECVAKLEEYSQRYPDDDRQGELRFLMGDSYRKSAKLLADRVATIEQAASRPDAQHVDPADRMELMVARRDRLRKSQTMFDEVVTIFRTTPPSDELDKLYLKLAHFYRADAAFDLGNYEQAIELYQIGAIRYENDPSSLAAHVQIVNAYVAMGRLDDARTANERARWMLRRMPGEAFEDSGVLARQYWEQYLAWAGQAGLWQDDKASEARATDTPTADLR